MIKFLSLSVIVLIHFQISWPCTANNESEYAVDCKTMLYPEVAAVPCYVYKLVCTNGQCCIPWDGSNEFVFQRSPCVCIGEEVLWDFVNMVMNMKCNFFAFCQCK